MKPTDEEQKFSTETAAPDEWHLYLLECHGGKLYAGIAKDVQARFKAHASGKGAKFTRANPPLRVVACRPYPDRSAASKAEYALKHLPRSLKPKFFSDANP
jgi:putative endonuclease